MLLRGSSGENGLPKTMVAECVKTVDLTADETDGTDGDAGRRARYAQLSKARRATFTPAYTNSMAWVMTEFRDHSPFCYEKTVIARGRGG